MHTEDILIQHPADLENLIEQALEKEAIAVDTEFVWERTYFPRLGLIQIALSDEQCYLVDPLALKDLSPLGELLSDRRVIKIFHDAPQDLAILHQATGAATQNIFDTRLAAGFAQLPATLSLSHLVQELLDIELSKEETRTDWLHRPLSPAQLAYAQDDVRYLGAVRVLLLSRIIGPKIRSWLQEELNLLNNPASYTGTVDALRYLRIRGTNSLNRRSMAILRNLTIWREGMARKLDRPRGHILKDANLVNLAKNSPATMEELENHCGLSKNALAKYAVTVLAIVTTTLEQPEDRLPKAFDAVRLSKTEKAALLNLHKLIDLKCGMLGIAPGLIGNSAELQMLIKTMHGSAALLPAGLRQTEGWRKCFLEDFFSQSRQK
jgi:ribonuclease D